MAMEWQLQSIRVGYEDDIVAALRASWEPFAVGFDEDEEQAVWFRKLVNVERGATATDRVHEEDGA